jgi:Co/Zn/Cd efflux system component
MQKQIKFLLWVAVLGLGLAAVSAIALNRGESISAM